MERYVLSARVLHWLMAAGFFFMWASGYAMTSLVAEDTALEEFLFGIHISAGVTLGGLLLLRILIRLFNTPPLLPDFMPSWEKLGSHLGHLGLYALPAAIIFVGWAETDFGGHGVNWFGVAMPKLFPTLDTLWGLQLETVTANLHKWFAYGMLALTVVHVVAVAKHRWVDGHDVLQRMAFGSTKD
ncbi:MAG: cytochrome B [Rhodobacteraceae bacterium]|nr:cytochrome B [Paracoccaceae bacterium]